MTCSRFHSDHYAIHVLGLSEEPDRSELLRHLKWNCETCSAGLKSALAFWYSFAFARTLQYVAGPPPRLRAKILAMIQVRPRRVFIPAWTAGRIAAGALIVFGGGTAVWNVARVSTEPRVRQAEARAASDRSALQKLALENQMLSRRRVEPQPSAVAPALPPSNSDSQKVAEISRELAAATVSTSAAAQALAAEQVKRSQLENENAAKAAQLIALASGIEESERRYAAIVQQLDRAKSTKDEELSQLSTARARIRELEDQVIQIRNVLDIQQKKLDQNLRLTAMVQTPGAKLIRLRATEAGQTAAGVALVSDNDRLVFYASNLPALAPGRVYQLWLIRDRGPAIVSAGTFSRSVKDAPSVQFRGSLLTGVRGVAVTEEPAGGSALPTGHKLLIGTPPD